MTGNWQIFECQPRNRSLIINASVGIGEKSYHQVESTTVEEG